MKVATNFVLSVSIFVRTILAAPVAGSQVDYSKIDYPPGTGENLPYYPPPPGGWENVNYPPGTGAGAGPSALQVFTFTSTYNVKAVPGEVLNGTTLVPGPADALGFFNYGINSVENTICYNITLINFVGDYQSPALTATHIHQANKGASGPPRIVFPNPIGDDKRRVSIGCIKGPFTTGIKALDGVTDTGAGFTVKQIEDNPANFFTDSHSKLYTLGVIRGQLA